DERLNPKSIVAFTASGDAAKRVARLHSQLPLLVFTPHEAVRTQLAVTWGAQTFVAPDVDSTDDMMVSMDKALLEMDDYAKGDLVVVVAGTPACLAGNTNMIHARGLGEAVSQTLASA